MNMASSHSQVGKTQRGRPKRAKINMFWTRHKYGRYFI